MANPAQARKRARQAVKQNAYNSSQRSTLRTAIKRLPESQQEKILEGYQKGISQARRVDFLFLMRKPSVSSTGCFRQELFGQSDAVSVAPGSDHYGVLVTYIADASQCAATSHVMEDLNVDAAS